MRLCNFDFTFFCMLRKCFFDITFSRGLSFCAVQSGSRSREYFSSSASKSPTLTTHIIDPVIDESREYLFHSLLHHDAISRFGFVKGVGAASEDQPHYNLTDDYYFTDGMRLVVWLSPSPVPPHFAQDLGWNESADPVREGKGESHMVPALMDD